MFRESSAIDSERTAASVRPLYAEYSKNENWFDGTPDSVDRRIAQAKKISNLCKAACVRLAGREAGAQYIALAHEMDSDRASLEGLRRDLLTAAMDRETARTKEKNYGHEPRRPHENRHVDTEHVFGFGLPKDKERDPSKKDFLNLQGGEYVGKRRAEARYFIAEQECNDLDELLIRAKNHAERLASTLPARQAQSVVSSFVQAVNSEYRTAARDYDMRFSSRNSRTASLNDFPADFMYLE